MESLSVAGPIPAVPPRRTIRLASILTAAAQHLSSSLSAAFRYLLASLTSLTSFLRRLHPFFPHLFYFLSLSLAGSLILRLLPTRLPGGPPHYLDLLFVSVSAITVSGLNTVELELFSTKQFMVLTVLMLTGGEVFLSLLTLLAHSRRRRAADPEALPDVASAIRRHCLAKLTNLVLVYILTIHLAGAIAITLYLRYAPSARGALRAKGLPLLPYAISATVSCFSNAGLIWTNENIIVFLRNSGLLVVLMALVFLGNMMYSTALRAVVWVASRVTGRDEYRYMLASPEKLGFLHLQPRGKATAVAASVAGLWAVQLAVFLGMEWGKSYYDGVNSVQKVVSGMFQATNSRHCGNSSVDVSQVSAAVTVVFVVAMFLPAYASFQPLQSEASGEVRESSSEKKTHSWHWVKIASMPEALYIAIFVLVLCIIERKNISTDPFNFSVLFLLFEVVSAYGNVGYSTGYGCSRQLHPDSACKDLWISLSGKFSHSGKLLIMFVMLFGRLKKFHFKGGKSWRMY